jgi:hypothetical protein
MRIVVAVAPTDFRRGIDGLARVCKEVLKQDPFGGWVFVFRNRPATALKVLVYDGRGFWLCHKRLSSGRFRWWGPPSIISKSCAAVCAAWSSPPSRRQAWTQRNFRYDHAAYDAVKRNLGRLVGLGQLRPAMERSLELMVRGSHPVEMSDEGLMTGEIEECLQVVLEALQNCDLPADDIAAWCRHMLAGDCVGFICDKELQAMRRHSEASRS